MKCVVVTDFTAWDFNTIGEARKWYNTVVKYAKSGRTDQGEGAQFVQLWRASWFYDRYDRGLWPISEWYNTDQEVA